MIFDISFIEASVSLQDNELGHDFITISFLHRNVFENLITKMYRGFFDNSGSDTTNLMKFKNKVIKEYIKEEYKQEILDDIKKLPIEDKIYKRKFEIIKKNVDIIRDKYIAHGILDPMESSEVDLKDIKELLKNGCELFQHLSFDVKSFYNPLLEGDGTNFENEFEYTAASTQKFIKHSFLTSGFIDKIECTYVEHCNAGVRNRLEKVLSDINSNRR